MLRKVQPARGYPGAVLLGIILACGEREGTAPLPAESLGPPASLSAAPAASLLIAGDSLRLTTTIHGVRGLPIGARVVWSSANPAVAHVTSNGLVTALSDGNTILSARLGSLSATVTVAVIEVHGSITFTQSIRGSDGKTRFDAVGYADRVLRPLPRPSQFASIAAPALSPDGAMLAVEVVRDVTEQVGEGGLDYTADLYVFPTTAPFDSAVRALAVGGSNRSPDWSPDGRRILYVHTASGFDTNHIYVVDIAGGVPTRLTSKPGVYFAPRWSPDGTRVAFADLSVGNGDVFIVNADGSGLTNVTRSPDYDGDPDWSPDATRLAFVSDQEDKRREIFVVDLTPGTFRRLTSVRWSATPRWSPDGRYVAFTAITLDFRLAIYVMRADGSHSVQLTQPALGGTDGNPAWRR